MNVLSKLMRPLIKPLGDALQVGRKAVAEAAPLRRSSRVAEPVAAKPAAADSKAAAADVRPRISEPVVYRALAPAKEWTTVKAAVDELQRKDRVIPYAATREDIAAAEKMLTSWFAFGAGAFSNLQIELAQLTDEVLDSSEPQHVAYRNELLLDLAKEIDLKTPALSGFERVEKDCKALIPHKPLVTARMTTRSGAELHARAVNGADVTKMTEFLAGLENVTFERRFPRVGSSDRAALARKLTMEAVNHADSCVRHVALNDKGEICALVDFVPTDPSRLAADAARATVKLDARAASCEVNLVVGDVAQGQGLGAQMLVQGMAQARQKGYAQMIANVADTNEPMRKLLSRLGFSEGFRNPHIDGYCAFVRPLNG